MTELARRGLADHRRALAGWCVGIAAYIALVAAIFPSIESSPDFDKRVENYPDILKSLFGISSGADITSGAGYLDVELFSFMLPLLVLVLAVGSGARAFAGEEDAGRLELVLAYPVRRHSVVLAKGAAVAAEIGVVCSCAGITMLVFDQIVDLQLSYARLFGALLSLASLGLLYGWLALSVGAAVPSRAFAIGVPAGAAAAAYLVSGLHALAGWLDPFRFLSPFWLVGSSPLQKGADDVGLIVVATVAIGVLLAGAFLVERRDLESP